MLVCNLRELSLFDNNDHSSDSTIGYYFPLKTITNTLRYINEESLGYFV